MDELVQHCLRELSFDGDFGCSPSRLKDFIQDFQSHTGSRQVVDDAYCGFIWSLIVQQPTVLVGFVAQGSTAEVAVAPQSRKGKTADDAAGEDAQVPRLQVIPNAESVPFFDLAARYGDTLRIATDPETTFAAITGSHVRPSKLTPMVYTVLQLITRGREKGASTVMIGRSTGYDQKTVHYILNQLISLDIVLKLRQGGTAQNIGLHKYFYERSEYWKEVREEASRLEPQAASGDGSTNAIANEDVNEDLQPQTSIQLGNFDNRHLSSLPIVRARIVELLSRCTNNLHSARNLLVSMGYNNPPKSDRRFFVTQLDKLVAEGTIEVVELRIPRRASDPGSGDRWLKCIRLASKDGKLSTSTSEVGPSSHAVVPIAQDSHDERFLDILEDEATCGLVANETLHRQMRDVIAKAGTSGIIQNDVAAALSDFDRRSIEMQLAQLEAAALPSQLADQAIVDVMETYGRERRHRYFTLSSYKAIMPGDSQHEERDLSMVGEFPPLNPDDFFEDDDALESQIDSLTTGASTSSAVKRKKSRKPRINPVLPDGTVKKGRPRKNPDGPTRQRKTKNPLLPDGSAKKGRPPKATNASTELRAAKRRRTTDVSDNPVQDEPPCKKRREHITDNFSHVEHSASASAASLPGLLGNLHSPHMIALSADESRTDNTPEDALVPSPRIVRPSALHGDRASHVDVSHDAELLPVSPAASSQMQGDQVHEQVTNAADTVPPRTALVDFNEEAVPEGGLLVAQSSIRLSSPISSVQEAPVHSRDMIAGDIPTRRPAPKAQGAGRTNISHALREQEFLQLLREHGGIMSINVREFYESHGALLERLAAAGTATSTRAGTRPDKRTVETTFSKMETKGDVKMVKTSVRTAIGGSKPIVVAYLSSLVPEELNAFLANLGRTPLPAQQQPRKRIHDCIDYTAQNLQRRAVPLAMLQMMEPGDETERWTRNSERADRLFTYDDDTVRDVLLAETTTLAQVSGFIVPKSLRARELHLMTVRALQAHAQLPSIVCKQQRILHLSFYHRDISVGDFCRVVSALLRSDELQVLLSSDEGRSTPLRELPKALYEAMQANRARSRSRILDVLETLRSLNLVTPLQPSLSTTPWITCAANGDHPTAFDPASLEGWTYQTPSVAPVYWRVSPVAPLHLWSLSEHAPPFWKDVNVQTEDECASYWNALREVSLSSGLARTITCPATGDSSTGPLRSSSNGTACISRAVSWKEGYILTWHQEQFIRRFAERTRAQTDDATWELEILRICRITSAPRPVVESLCRKAVSNYEGELRKARGRAARSGAAKTQNAAKAVLAQRAALEKEQRSSEWDKLVQRVCPETPSAPLAVRFRRLRTRFMAGVSVDQQQWEEALTQAMKDAELVRPGTGNAVVPVFKIAGSSSLVPVEAPPIAPNSLWPLPLPTRIPPQVISVPEKSVQSIIDAMGPPRNPEDQPKKKKKKKSGRKPKNADEDVERAEEAGAAPPSTIRQRATRRRFFWNPEYDELVRDASVVIRARCRGLGIGRIDWGALEKVFPVVPRNSVRHRIQKHLDIPGEADYLARLENRWYELWLQYRGSERLPDGDSQSLVDFPIAEHVEFLRKHVDKRALRIGFAETEEATALALPSSVDLLLSSYKVAEKLTTTPTFDFLWNSVIDEGREKGLAVVAFSPWVDHMPGDPDGNSSSVVIAESALKMVLSTPHSAYDADRASAMLHALGEEAVANARTSLLARGVISNVTSDPKKPRPGRTLKISEMNERALGGPIAEDLFTDAAAFGDSFIGSTEETEPITFDPARNNWNEWSFTATDGDLAALLERVSDNKLDFEIDLTHARAQRAVVDWQSKKTDDEQIEGVVLYRLRAEETHPPAERPGSSAPSDLLAASAASLKPSSSSPISAPLAVIEGLEKAPSQAIHGKNASGEPASCQLQTKGIIDCEECVASEMTEFLACLSDEEESLLAKILAAVQQKGEEGMAEDELAVLDIRACDLVDGLIDGDAPPIMRVGYAMRTLVSIEHAAVWTVVIREEPLTRALPRRWRDIHGTWLPRVWTAARRAVVGLAVFHPGLTLAELRWRLRAVYDPQEVDELVHTLHREGVLTLRRLGDHPEPIEWTREDEVFVLAVEAKPWYSC